MLLTDGEVLRVGGEEPSLYDPATNAWTQATTGGVVPTTGPTVGLAAECCQTVRLADGRVMAIGASLAWIYDPTDNSWSPAAAPLTERSPDTMTVALLPDGNVLVAGGSANLNGAEGPSNSAEIYDPESDTWTPTQPMITRRRDALSAPLGNGDVLVAGGCSTYCLGSSTNEGVLRVEPYKYALATAEVYDPASELWRSVAPMGVPRERDCCRATVLPEERVLVTGAAEEGQPASTTMETYSVEREEWAVAGSMPGDRTGYSATLLPSGRVLLAGGGTLSTDLDLVEAYEPSTGSFTTLAPMNTPRYQQAAILLSDGKVLVAGGISLPGGEIFGAELFTFPSAGHPASPERATALPTATVSNLSHVSIKPPTIRLHAHGASGRGKAAQAGKGLASVEYTARLTGSSAFQLQRRVGASCHKHEHRRQRCTQYVTIGGFSHCVVAGHHRFALTRGMLRHALRAGSYRFKVFTVTAEGAGASAYAGFRVIG